MKNAPRILFVGIFLFGLFVFPILTLLKPQDQVSAYEQRALASIPTISKQKVWDGTYFNEWETALSDHIVLRDTMLKLHTRLSLLLEKPVVNDLVIEKEKLLDFYGYSNWNLVYLSNEAKTVAQSYKKLNDIVTSYGGYFIYVGVPQQSTYFSEYYPKYMDSRQWHTTAIRTEFSAAMEEAGVPFLNMTELYKKEGNPDEYYFNTDHHYTYAGAYESSKAIVERINTETGWQIPKMEKKDLIWEQLLNPFLGSSNRKLYALHPTEDKIEIAYPKEEIPFSRTDNGVPTSAQIYSLPENDKTMVDYTVYMGGDIGETIIETSRPSLRKALIVGDSFTNPLETLLWMSFDETRSLDYRHYSEKNLLDYIKEYQPDVVITVRDESVYLSQEGNGAIS